MPPLQTAHAFLQRELQAIPEDWALTAVGKDCYNALAYMFSSRIVIGVPHPTGSYGNQFHGLFDVEKRLYPEFKGQVESILHCERKQAIRLSVK